MPKPMKKKHLLLALVFLLSLRTLCAQQIFVGADFDTRFDNREDAACNIDDSHTYFSMRLTPKAGVLWGEKNRLVVGAELLKDFGDGSGFMSSVKPQIYYQFETENVRAMAGIFPRSLLRGRYDPSFLGSAYSFYENCLEGFGAQYRSAKGSYVELAIDWEGMQQPRVREKFRLLSAGEYREGGGWYLGYAMTLLHYAKPSDPTPEEGVVDHIQINPYVGFRLSGSWSFDVRAGLIQTLQRDRIRETGWKDPRGGRLLLSLSRWGASLTNELYVGENLMPFYDIYGSGLYAGGPFYATPKRIYNQTQIAYNRRFFGDTLGIQAGLVFHYDGVGLGLQQILKISVNLHKTVYRAKK